MDAIAEAKTLAVEIRQSMLEHHRGRAAEAILQQPRSLKIIENLLEMHQGYKAGMTEDQTRLTEAVTCLLLEIAKLRDARRIRGRRTMADEFIDGTAPRLWEMVRKLESLLE